MTTIAEERPFVKQPNRQEVAPECEALTAADFLEAGANTRITSGRGGDLPRRRHQFECCIHPWMRAAVTVRR